MPLNPDVAAPHLADDFTFLAMEKMFDRLLKKNNPPAALVVQYQTGKHVSHGPDPARLSFTARLTARSLTQLMADPRNIFHPVSLRHPPRGYAVNPLGLPLARPNSLHQG